MSALLLKDFYVMWKQTRVLLILILVFSCLPGAFYPTFAVVYAAILPYTAMAYDERSKWGQLAAMLPYADRERVLQVMMNIVSNSIKYTPDGGHIAISAGRRDSRVWMVVDDDGIGIPEEDRPRIFERFYRVDKARSRQSGGTGLGLSIAKELVDRHQGILALEDKEGPGLRIRLELKIEGPDHG